MATLAIGLRARFGRAGLAPAGFHQEVSPSHLRFLLFHAFPSAITTPAVSRVSSFDFFFLFAHPCIRAGVRFCSTLSLGLIGVHPYSCSARVSSSIRCCPPNISSVMKDHDELFELPPLQGGG